MAIRTKTKYPGVYFIPGKSSSGRNIKRFYVTFRRGGKLYEEPAKVLIGDGPDTRIAETPQEANAWRSRRIDEVERAETNGYKDLTLAQAWDIRKGVVKEISAATRSYYKNYVLPRFGNKKAAAITSLEVEELGAELYRAGKAPGTVWQVTSLVVRVVKWAADKGLIPPSALNPDLPSFDNEVTESLTPDQLAQYWRTLDEWPEQHDADFFRVMLLTGIRKNALASIEWDDINFETGFLRLQAVKAKSGKAKEIPLSARALAIFKDMHRGESKYVWPGIRTHRKNFTTVGAKIRDAAGLPETFRPCHGLRHSFASALASSGKVDLYTIQHLLTHSSSAMTQRYAHLSDDALKRAAVVVDDELGPGKKTEE